MRPGRCLRPRGPLRPASSAVPEGASRLRSVVGVLDLDIESYCPRRAAAARTRSCSTATATLVLAATITGIERAASQPASGTSRPEPGGADQQRNACAAAQARTCAAAAGGRGEIDRQAGALQRRRARSATTSTALGAVPASSPLSRPSAELRAPAMAACKPEAREFGQQAQQAQAHASRHPDDRRGESAWLGRARRSRRRSRCGPEESLHAFHETLLARRVAVAILAKRFLELLQQFALLGG